MNSTSTLNILIDDRNSITSGFIDYKEINNLATANSIVEGSEIIIVSCSQIIDPTTGEIHIYPNQQIYQVPFKGESLGISVNPNLGLPPEPISYDSSSISSTTSLTLQEIGAISIALNNKESFVWIRHSQEEFRKTINFLGINYGFRKD